MEKEGILDSVHQKWELIRRKSLEKVIQDHVKMQGLDL